MDDELRRVRRELREQLLLLRRRAVAHNRDEEEVAIMAAREGACLILDVRDERLALRGGALLEARLEDARRVVLVQHREEGAAEEGEDLVDEPLAVRVGRLLGAQPLP